MVVRLLRRVILAVALGNVSMLYAGMVAAAPESGRSLQSDAVSSHGLAPMPSVNTSSIANSAGQSPAFYVDPESVASVWLTSHPVDSRSADIQSAIVSKPAAHWFTGGTGDIGAAVAKYVGRAASHNQLPILVAYNIPGRDCGQHSAGGTGSPGAYRTWISTFAAAIGPRQAVVVLEPDALAQLDCLSAGAQVERLSLLTYATQQFKTKAPSAKVYLDIGHDGWLTVAVAAQRLMQAGVVDARGFSLNVSNFKLTTDEKTYGDAIAATLAHEGLAKRFVIDTSRNGSGPPGSQWCDPSGRRLGTPSTVLREGATPEMTLWIKNPGVSDGCTDTAGTFDPALAYNLVHGH